MTWSTSRPASRMWALVIVGPYHAEVCQYEPRTRRWYARTGAVYQHGSEWASTDGLDRRVPLQWHPLPGHAELTP